MKNLTWQNPEQLFVAQELINKVKSKCCGIKEHEICNALWPKKDDANETLYALISRLKRELSRTTDFDIVSDRGRAYILRKRKSGN